MKNFRDLQVWHKALHVALLTYGLTKAFPREELYGLVNQLRRAAVSIPTNIAEGCGRGSDRDLARFLYIAMGSASETEYLLLLSHELGYLDSGQYQDISRSTKE